MERGGHGLLGPPCPTLLRPAGRPPVKRPYSRFRGNSSTGKVACSRFLPHWTPHAVRLCSKPGVETRRGIIGIGGAKGGAWRRRGDAARHKEAGEGSEGIHGREFHPVPTCYTHFGWQPLSRFVSWEGNGQVQIPN
jgi:hypothetical protein